MNKNLFTETCPSIWFFSLHLANRVEKRVVRSSACNAKVNGWFAWRIDAWEQEQRRVPGPTKRSLKSEKIKKQAKQAHKIGGCVMIGFAGLGNMCLYFANKKLHNENSINHWPITCIYIHAADLCQLYYPVSKSANLTLKMCFFRSSTKNFMTLFLLYG